MKKICILTGSHLSNNPRVVKEANTLFKDGYEVSIFTVWTNIDLLTQDRQLIHEKIEYNGIDLTNWNGVKAYTWRIHRKLIEKLNFYLKIESPLSLGYALPIFKKKLQMSNADIFVGHQEVGLYLGCYLLKQGKKVGFDFEDWYSEDLLPNANRNRPIRLLKKLEAYALKEGSFVLTTSNALSNKLRQDYNIQTAPHVIYNVFPYQKHKKEVRTTDRIYLVWYSQVVGPGRGLEPFIKALSMVPDIPIEITFLGAISTEFRDFLLNIKPINDLHVFHFTETILPERLPEFLCSFDVGLALELKTPQSRNLTITNKVFQYLQSGLPVIATDTEGQKEISDLAGNAIFLVSIEESESINDAIRSLYIKEDLFEAKKYAKKIFENKFNWDIEKHKLLSVFKEII
jgi:glycosyltransferase involved in cell wall biosynthesis